MGYRVTHNGMEIEYRNNIAEVNTYIDDCISKYSYLNPTLLYNYKIGKAHILIYRYYTLYSEMFLIEEV